MRREACLASGVFSSPAARAKGPRSRLIDPAEPFFKYLEGNPMSREIDEKAQKIHNPQAEFDQPSDVVKDSELSLTEKKKALENLEQDAHQLMTASNEGMAPENDHVAEHEPKLDEVVKAQQRIGEKPQHKPTQ
jgi:hypothetical protein